MDSTPHGELSRVGGLSHDAKALSNYCALCIAKPPWNASGRVIFQDHPLRRCFQDVQAALAHAYLTPDPLARAVGEMILGATKPETTL